MKSAMQAERWELVTRLYGAALQREEAERAAFLADACVGDDELRRDVESLLAQAGKAENFPEKPAVEVAAGEAWAGAGEFPSSPTAALGLGATVSHYLKLARPVALKFLPSI